ncbi:MAG: AmmeMemoRadiSam system protein B [Candidatus Magasanikbacteria bacterium]
MKKSSLLIISLFLLALIIVSGLLFGQKKIDAKIATGEISANNNFPVVSSSTSPTALHFESLPPDTYQAFYNNTKTVPNIGEIKGAIVPHHLLAGYIPATLFSYLEKQKPSVVVLFGPNHFFKGQGKAVATDLDWQTDFGVVPTDKNIIKKLAEKNVITIDNEAIQTEHALGGEMPFLAKSLPGTKVISFMLRYGTSDEVTNQLAQELKEILPKDAVIVASVDFSHYQTLPSSNFHDELSRAIINNFDFPRIKKLEIDSQPSVNLFLKLMESYGTQKMAYELHNNSANLINNPAVAEGTSYYSPYFVKGEPQKVKIASILNFGDMMLDRSVKKQIDANGGGEYIFKTLAGQEDRFFQGMDIVMANLEGPFANSRRATTKSIAFRFDPALISTLKKYNFSLFNLANNHSLDMSARGFEESKTNLKNANIDFYGQQYTVGDNSLLIKQVGDFKFGFIGLDDTVNKIKISEVKKLMDKTKTNGADFVVVNVHWGEEYKEISNTRQRQLGHSLIDLGADVIIGHHPHVVEEMEIYKNRPIYYSLGNFVFDQYFSVPTQQGLGVGLVFEEKNGQKSISNYVFPLEGIKSQVRQMKYTPAMKYFADWTTKSRLGSFKFNNFNLIINF